MNKHNPGRVLLALPYAGEGHYGTDLSDAKPLGDKHRTRSTPVIRFAGKRVDWISSSLRGESIDEILSITCKRICLINYNSDPGRVSVAPAVKEVRTLPSLSGISTARNTIKD